MTHSRVSEGYSANNSLNVWVYRACAQTPRPHPYLPKPTARKIASTKPSTVNTDASTATATPTPRAVAEVTGPMEAVLTPATADPPATATKFRTVDELVNVTQSGFRSPPKIPSAVARAPSGTAVRSASTTS